MDAEDFGRRMCVAVDVEGYSKRIESEQGDLQKRLTGIINAAASAARLPVEQWLVQEQGDGQLILAPLDGTEPRYIDEFVRQLDAGLSRHNRERVPEARMRMRVALHHGVAGAAANGFVGDAPILACRLLDASVCRRALADSDANLVLIVSAELYRDDVLAEHTTLHPDEFTRVVIEEEKVRTEAWLWLPSGHGSETLREARQRNGRVSPARRDARPTFDQRAHTITNVGKARAQTIHFGTVVRPVPAGEHDDG